MVGDLPIGWYCTVAAPVLLKCLSPFLARTVGDLPMGWYSVSY